MKSLTILLACLSITAALDCDSTEIACKNDEKCITQRYVCDNDNDCGDSSDEDEELCQVWKNDHCDRNSVQCTTPTGDTSCVEISFYCKPENECQGDLDDRICVMIENGILNKLSNISIPIEGGNLNRSLELGDKFRDLQANTISHESCPSMYTLVGDQCLSFFYIGSMSWGEAGAFCKVLGGELMIFRNITQYAAIVQHLQRYGISSSFWIGGNFQSPALGWTWTDGSPMELGSPFWATRYSRTCVERNVTVARTEATCYRYTQAPDALLGGECVSLSFEHYHQMIDEDCLKKMSPLCVSTDADFPRRPFSK